jgi:endonuclease/exonuclease/phosphatase family metal-dependent hydrolase
MSDSTASNSVAESLALRRALRAFPTRRAWLESASGPALAARLAAHLAPVQCFSPSKNAPAALRPVSHAAPAVESCTTAGAPTAEALHVVHWNVLHGLQFDAIAAALQNSPELAPADLITLNEVDVGLSRSGSRHVAFDLAARLGLHAAWAAQFLELDGGANRGNAPQPHQPGECWFGLALLSRFPIAAPRRIELPSPAGLLFDRECKAGAFVALAARIEHPVRPFTAIVTHLDVHGTPESRAAQMRAVLEHLPPGPAILAGDFNTTTFARGSLWRSLATLTMLASGPKARLSDRLLRPYRPRGRPYEPLFDVLAQQQFDFERFNSTDASLDVHFADVHELDAFPVPLRRTVLRALGWVERRNGMRLDWITARGFVPDPARPACAVPSLMRGAGAASDHAPVACGLRLV